jgi:hypothetical protein
MKATWTWKWLWVAPLALGWAGAANALSITGVTAVKNVGNSANSAFNEDRGFESSAAVLSSGGSVAEAVGASVDAATRYSMINAHGWGFGSLAAQTYSSDYTVTFTVNTTNALTQYTVDVSSLLRGSIALQDDASNGGARADMSAVAGSLGGIANASLSLADPGGFTGIHNGSAPQGDGSVTDFVDINASNLLTLANQTGTNTYVLRFTWTTMVQGLENGFFGGVDDAGVRLGEDLPPPGSAGLDGANCTVCNYDPTNFGARVQANDGHFLDINATVTFVPEPGTLLMLGAGIAGIASWGRKRA